MTKQSGLGDRLLIGGALDVGRQQVGAGAGAHVLDGRRGRNSRRQGGDGGGQEGVRGGRVVGFGTGHEGTPSYREETGQLGRA